MFIRVNVLYGILFVVYESVTIKINDYNKLHSLLIHAHFSSRIVF